MVATVASSTLPSLNGAQTSDSSAFARASDIPPIASSATRKRFNIM
jgi:hypothetical protein